MKRNFLIGKFWNPDHVMDALANLRNAGVKAQDVFAPFPIHGIEPLLDIKRTRLSVATFIYGMIGFLTAVTMISLIYGLIWPMDIGGKPTLPFPDYVPIAFEMTVLFACHGVVYTFLIVSEYYPGKKAVLLDPRQTDDVFVIAIDSAQIGNTSESDVNKILSDNGAYYVGQRTV